MLYNNLQMHDSFFPPEQEYWLFFHNFYFLKPSSLIISHYVFFLTLHKDI